jgi:hypothetical protein
MLRDPLHEATEAEVAAGRRTARIQAALRRWKRRAEWAAGTAALVAAIFAAGAKAWLLLRSRDVGRADERPNGGDRMFVDRVDKPARNKD